MAVQIWDEKNCLRIVFNGNTVIVNKVQIKTIEDIRQDTLRLDLGEGALKHIYIRYDEVTNPVVYGSRDELKTALLLMMSSESGGGGVINGEGLATEASQQQELTLLGQVIQKLDTLNGSIQNIHTGGNREPLLVDESQSGTIYKGYAVEPTLTSEPHWAILRIYSNGLITKYEWADGNSYYDNIWDNRYGLVYLLNFNPDDNGIR